MKESNCPSCQKVMSIHDADGLTSKCEDCRLTWIPAAQPDPLTVGRPTAADQPEGDLCSSLPAALICPSCESPSFRTLSFRSIEFETVITAKESCSIQGSAEADSRDIEAEQSINPLNAVVASVDAVGCFSTCCSSLFSLPFRPPEFLESPLMMRCVNCTRVSDCRLRGATADVIVSREVGVPLKVGH